MRLSHTFFLWRLERAELFIIRSHKNTRRCRPYATIVKCFLLYYTHTDSWNKTLCESSDCERGVKAVRLLMGRRGIAWCGFGGCGRKERKSQREESNEKWARVHRHTEARFKLNWQKAFRQTEDPDMSTGGWTQYLESDRRINKHMGQNKDFREREKYKGRSVFFFPQKPKGQNVYSKMKIWLASVCII